MGLSGRKVKQRIGPDPRNLTWADDASKFGSAYLSKFGFDASSGKGLGVSGEGRTSHIKVSQKLDMLGIGADQAKASGKDGIAWKQNKDFESLLRRLNESNEEKNVEEEEKKDEEEKEEEEESAEDKKERKRKRKEEKERAKAEKKERKKRKKEKDEDEDSVKEKKKEKKRKREEETEKKDKKKKRKRDEEEEETKDKKEKKRKREEKEEDKKEVPATRPAIPRHRAHRARNIAAKSFASKSSAAIDEILGIASTSATTSTDVTPGTLTPIDTPPLEKLTTSTKSVADYFKERLLAKSTTIKVEHAIKAVEPDDDEDEDDYRPRFGLGMRRGI